MVKAFTYIGDLSTALDYVRWRLDDINETVTVDETNSPSPYLWDATYAALFAKYGVQEGAARAAEQIALRISKNISSFGEQGGIRFSKRNHYNAYRDLAAQIRAELSWDEDDDIPTGVSIRAIKAGVDDTYWPYRRYEQYPPPPVPEIVVE